MNAVSAAEAKAAFGVFDTDKNGTIRPDKYKAALTFATTAGAELTAAEADMVLDHLDLNQHGVLDIARAVDRLEALRDARQAADGSMTDVPAPVAKVKSLGEDEAAPSRWGRLRSSLQHVVADDGAKYTELAPLREFVESGDVALVRASYLLELAATKDQKFERRQALPASALVDKPMLDRSFRELSEWDDYLRAPKYPWHSQLMRFPPIVVASYAWGDKAHPDKDARQLREVLAPAIEWYMAERAKLIKEGGCGGAPKLSNSFTADGADFGIFLDYSSMHQHAPEANMCAECQQGFSAGTGPCDKHARTQAEAAAFGRALGSMDLLYAHQRTCVWRLTRRIGPSENEAGEPRLEYSERGWPFFETTVSQLIKLAPNVLDLGTEKAVEALKKFEGRARPVDDLVERASYGHSLGSAGVHGKLFDARRPPLLPDDFKLQMEGKTLTNGKDRDVVVVAQNRVANAVLGGAQSLDYSALGWGAADAQLLAKALPWCRKLRALNVSSNNLGAEGAEHLGVYLKTNPSLAELKYAATTRVLGLMPGPSPAAPPWSTNV